jgi:membrane protein YdbS with pleckstrin-like domain
MTDKPIAPEKPREKKTWRLDELDNILHLSIVLQICSLLVAAGMLEMFARGGMFFLVCLKAILGYWLMFLFLYKRRANSLTKVDAMLIRYGYLPWLPIAACIQMVLEILVRI